MNAWFVSEKDLIPEQRQVIDLPINGRFFVIGPPGSGKTNLLLLRAKYLSLSDKPNILILVFTRTLREFIVTGAKQYYFSPEKVQTYNSWARHLLYEANITVPIVSDFEIDRLNIIKGLEQLIDEEKITDQRYDAILLDEAHDYLPEEINIIRKFSANMFSVGDARQQIYRKKDTRSIELLKSISKTIELKHHFRNGIKICKLADQVMIGQALYNEMEESSRYKEKIRPSSVKFISCSSFDEQMEILVKDLHTQLDAYPDELLGIVCPRREELERIKANLVFSDLSDLCVFQDSVSGYVRFDPDRVICVSTIHGAKGLEFTALHMLACETFHSFPKINRNLTFTGITRAKTSLSLYYTGDLYAYLESALAALFPKSTKTDISELFTRRK
jgi:superfamily I DNA/RNA helicase